MRRDTTGGHRPAGLLAERRTPGRRMGATVVLAAALLLSSLPHASAEELPGRTERVSVASDGTQANGPSTTPSISADGRYVAFASEATNLAPGDTNDVVDVFVHDRATGVTERVSVSSDGEQANGNSGKPAVSADGRYVAFHSDATNLAPGLTADRGLCATFLPWPVSLCPYTFVHDRVAGTTELVSVSTDGTPAAGYKPLVGTNCATTEPAITPDGRHVLFGSSASNLVPGDINEAWDLFLRDRVAGTTERVSLPDDGVQFGGDSCYGSVSADGDRVAFGNGGQVFVRDRADDATVLVSVASDGEPGNSTSAYASISGDGRHVAFTSWATNLVPGGRLCERSRSVGGLTIEEPDVTDCNSVFVRDIDAGLTQHVAVRSDGRHYGWRHSSQAVGAISHDGRMVLFSGISVHDRLTGVTELASVAGDGTPAEGASGLRALSADGRYVAFESAASNLVAHDTNEVTDVFVRDRGPVLGVGGMQAAVTSEGMRVSGWATFAGVRVVAADDPDDDGAAGAAEAGGELTGAEVVYRPQRADLLVRLRVSRLPGFRGVAGDSVPSLGRPQLIGVTGAPAVVYGLEAHVGTERYEVRVTRWSPEDPDRGGSFGLYRCTLVCERVASLSGGYGTTGEEIRVAVPLAALGVSEGESLEGLRAYTSLAAPPAEPAHELDHVLLGDAVLPDRTVQLGVAPADVPAEGVEFSVPAVLSDDVFTADIDLDLLEPGDHTVWARACLGDLCGPPVAARMHAAAP